jgi:hypothetical protein
VAKHRKRRRIGLGKFWFVNEKTVILGLFKPMAA